jgi:acetyl esterase/lipase
LQVHRDLPYSEPKDRLRTLDIYAPADGDAHPVVVWIHGGGWQTGDKAEVHQKPQAFVGKGFVLVSANYRLLPDATIRQMAADVAKAVRWVHDHAVEYGGDPKSIFVMGHSAGAQLAALVCTDEKYLKAEGLSLAAIKGCVPVDGGTYDVPMQIANVDRRTADVFRRKFGDEENRKDLSAVTHVARGKGIPPFLVLYVAGHPRTGGQSRRLAEVLGNVGISARAYAAEGKDHRSINADFGEPDDGPTEAVFEFLAGVLREESL